MGHAVVSDLDRNQHCFSEVIYRAVPAAWRLRLMARAADRLEPSAGRHAR